MMRLLGLLGCMLLAVIAAEITHLPGDNQAGPRPADAARSTDQARTRMVPDPRASSQWQAIILARPLFKPDRKPDAHTVAGNAVLPRLAGIVASPNDAVAIFQPVGNGRPLVVRDGEMVSGWEVTTIARDEVSLQKASDSLVLRPSFGNLAAKAETQPRTRWEAAAATGLLRARWSNPQLQP